MADKKDNEKKPSPFEHLMRVAGRDAGLFYTADGTAYAAVRFKAHLETWAVRSFDFEEWLTARYVADTKNAPNKEQLTAAINSINARARHEAEEGQVYTRVARVGTGSGSKTIYLDLADQKRHAVQITEHGWDVIAAPPSGVHFLRHGGMKPLPLPARGGSITQLRPFVNVASDDDFALLVGYIHALLGGIPKLRHLALRGGDGSAKTTTAKVVASLVDPVDEPGSPPRKEEDLVVAARGCYLLVIDNISRLPDWLSDALCRLSTGGSLSKRKNYTDGDEFRIAVRRPVILTGIPQFVVNADLASRTLALELPPIVRRRTEAEFLERFDRERPQIFGALLDGLAEGLRRERKIEILNPPRMADAYKWALACETASFPEGTYEAAYRANNEKRVNDHIEANPVVGRVLEVMGNRTAPWEGTMEDLLAALKNDCHLDALRSPESLAAALNRATGILHAEGLQFERIRREGGTGRRLVRLTAIAARTVAESDSCGGQVDATVTANLLNTGDLQPGDGCDGSSHLVGEEGKVKEERGEVRPDNRHDRHTVTAAPALAVDLLADQVVLANLPHSEEAAITLDQLAVLWDVLAHRLGHGRVRLSLRRQVTCGAVRRTRHALPRYWRSPCP